MVKHILITGGLGYVGGRVAAHLREQCSALDVRLASYRERPALPAWTRGFDVRRVDLGDHEAIASCLDGVDAVIHLATPEGFNNLVEKAIERDVEKFIYISTCHVYGENLKGRVTEETETKPITPYAMAHLDAEAKLSELGSPGGLEWTCLRLSNGYGFPMDSDIAQWNLVVNNFCMQMVRDGKIELKSSGATVRDFIALKDAARAVEHVLRADTKAVCGQIFNVGGECTMSVLDMAKRVASVYRKIHGISECPVRIQSKADGKEPVEPLEYSIDRLRDTGFELQGMMEQEIKRTLQVAGEQAL